MEARSNIHKILNTKEILTKMERFCAYQERCEQDVRKKLLSFSLPSSETDKVIDALIDGNYINEARFAKLFVSGKFRIKHWGRIKIKSELRKRRISENCIAEAMKEIDEAEYINTVQQLLNKQINLSNNKINHDLRVKIARYLQSKGFEQQLVMDELNQIK